MKQKVRLTESQLHRVIKESIRRYIKEEAGRMDLYFCCQQPMLDHILQGMPIRLNNDNSIYGKGLYCFTSLHDARYNGQCYGNCILHITPFDQQPLIKKCGNSTIAVVQPEYFEPIDYSVDGGRTFQPIDEDAFYGY